MQLGNLGIEDGAIPKGSSTCWWRHHDTDGSRIPRSTSAGERIAVVAVTRPCVQRLDRANDGREEKGSSPFWICGRGGRFALWSVVSRRRCTL